MTDEGTWACFDELLYASRYEREGFYPCDEQGDEVEKRHFGVSERRPVRLHGRSVVVLRDGGMDPRRHGRRRF